MAFAVETCLIIAKENNIKNIIFPPMGLGLFSNFTVEEVAEAMIQFIKQYKDVDYFDSITIETSNEDVYTVFSKKIQESEIPLL